MTQPDFLFHIVSASGVPIYRQLMDQIIAMMTSGRLKPGMFLPSIRDVGKKLEINQMTVSKVYSILEREGILENVRGQGMRVIGLVTTQATMKKRLEMMDPLIKQVIHSAAQLQLSKKNVMGMMDNTWKE